MRDSDYDRLEEICDCEFCRHREWTPRAYFVAILFVLSLLLLALCGSMCFGQVDSPSTCRVIELDETNGLALGYGSGVLVAKDDRSGYVLTALHVATDDKHPLSQFVAIFPHSNQFAYAVREIHFSRKTEADISLLVIESPTDIAPRHIDWRIPTEGEKVWQSGYGNHDDKPREAWSRVLPLIERTSHGVTKEYTTPSLLLLDKPSRSGDSGGPIIDAQGRVVGIISGTTNKQGFHVTVGDQAWLKRILPGQEKSILVRP